MIYLLIEHSGSHLVPHSYTEDENVAKAWIEEYFTLVKEREILFSQKELWDHNERKYTTMNGHNRPNKHEFNATLGDLERVNWQISAVQPVPSDLHPSLIPEYTAKRERALAPLLKVKGDIEAKLEIFRHKWGIVANDVQAAIDAYEDKKLEVLGHPPVVPDVIRLRSYVRLEKYIPA